MEPSYDSRKETQKHIYRVRLYVSQMSDNLNRRWEAHDASKLRPQHTAVDYSEIQECETLEDAVAIVEDTIREEFNEKAYPVYDLDAIQEEVQAIWDKRVKEDQ